MGVQKEILKSRQLNIELDDPEIAAFREIHAQWGIMPGDIVYALIKAKIAEYQKTKALIFAPAAPIDPAAILRKGEQAAAEKERPEADRSPPTPTQSARSKRPA